MTDDESAFALVATGALQDTILELYLVNLLSNSEKRSLEEITQYMGYAFPCSIKYLPNDLFTINQQTIEITADNELLSNKAKEYAKRLIKKMVFPTKYKKDCFEYDLGRFFDDSYYTAAEQEFIDLMFNELLDIANLKEVSNQNSLSDTIHFNDIYYCAFQATRNIFNDILQKKLHKGDNIMSYFCAGKLHAFDIGEMLFEAEKYDCYYDKFAFLKCDLETNKNLFIKNFLNTVIGMFREARARIDLYPKFGTKYKVLNEN